MSAVSEVKIRIRAEVQYGGGKVQHVGREVRALHGDKADEVRDTVTLALRQVNEELRELVR